VSTPLGGVPEIVRIGRWLAEATPPPKARLLMRIAVNTDRSVIRVQNGI
jgi:hypothetical protein